MSIAIQPIIGPPPAKSVARARLNLVTFLPDGVQGYDPGGGANPRIFLKLEEAWTRKAGIEPDINRAVCSYKEFAKLGGNADVSGKIEFWYTSAPGNAQADVTLEGERIVAVESSGQGDTPDQGVTTFEYRLFFSDFRERYVSPRGGRLEAGIINAGPKPKEGSENPEDEQQLAGVNFLPVDPPAAPELSLRELIALCLTKMGLAGTHLPNVVDGIDAPRDLKWFGNHAPTELAKLLALCGCAFIPELDGTATIQQQTNDGTPALPAGEAIPEQRIPKVDRRGKFVIFSSYPRRVIGTTTDQVSSDLPSDVTGLTWYFVIQNKAGQWVPIQQCDLLKANGVIDVFKQVRDNFTAVDPQYRNRVIEQAFRCIQAEQDPPAFASPVLARRFEANGKDYDIQITAAPALYRASGIWDNALSPIEIGILLRNEFDVLLLDRALVRVTGPTHDPHKDFGGAAPFTIRYSYEMSDPLPIEEKGQNAIKYFPRYFHVGFTAGGAAGGVGGNVTQMSDDDVENAIDGETKDAIILTRPQWRLLHVDGADANRADLEGKAAAEAQLYLKDASKPDRIIAARGFAPIAPSGLVTEVEWDQEKLKTTARLCDWFSPAGNLAEQHELRKRERGETGEAYPNQGATEPARIALGESGAQQPVLPISPPPAGPLGPSWRLIEVSDVFPGGGFYTLLDVSGAAQQLGVDAIAGKDLVMPEGMKIGNADTKTIGVNLIESGQYTHVLPIGSYQIAFPIGHYHKDPDPAHNQAAQDNDILALTLLQEVDLQLVDVRGSDGGTGGAGEYWGIVVEGRVNGHDVDGVDLNLPDKGERIPAKPRRVAWENAWENKAPAGSHALPVDGTCFVKGRWVGSTLTGDPQYRGWCSPAAPRECLLADDGTGDNASTPSGNATYKYNLTDLITGNAVATGKSPTWRRPRGILVGPASRGRYIQQGDDFVLLETDEQAEIDPCPSS